jgi:hypothetical protein
VAAALFIGTSCFFALFSLQRFRASRAAAAAAAPGAATAPPVNLLSLVGSELVYAALIVAGVTMARHPADRHGVISVPDHGPGSEPVLWPVMIVCFVSGFVLVAVGGIIRAVQQLKRSARSERDARGQQ